MTDEDHPHVIWRFGDHALDTETYELRRGDQTVPIEPQVYDVLALLVERHDRVVTKEELLDVVWGDRFVSESALTSRIKAARRAVGDDGQRQLVIRTVHGRGYRFVADLEADRSEPAAPLAPADPALVPPAGRRLPETKWARSGGYQIAYQVVGEGERDLVFIPGFVSNLDLYWEHPGMAVMFERLSSMGRLILLDKRGTGVSERVPPDRLPTLEERMDDVRAVLDAVGCERPTIIGISEGGPMSLLFAATYPERVDRLVLYGTFPNDPFVDPVRFAERTRDLWGSGRVLGMLAPSWVRDDTEDRANLRFLARFERQSATPDAAAAIVEMVSATDARAVLGSISAPTLVLHRADDRVVLFDRAEALARAIPGAELVALPGRDHFPWVRAGDLVDEIERFLSRRPVVAVPADGVLATMVFTSAPVPVLRAVVEGAGGEVVGGPDGVELGVFAGPARAIRCALELAATTPSLACAVHTSEVERRAGEVWGPGVRLGAVALARAGAGEVVVTRTVRDLVVGSGLTFAARGTIEIADLDERWEAFVACA